MNVVNHTVFGWSITQTTFSDGDTQSAVYREDVRIEKSQSWMPWTKGERIFIEYPKTLTDADILAQRGNFVAKVDFAGKIFPKGRYVLKAVGDSENWCLNHSLNENDAPDMTCTWLSVGEKYTASKGTLFLIATGDTTIGTGPLAVEVTSNLLTVDALTNTAIFTFSRRK